MADHVNDAPNPIVNIGIFMSLPRYLPISPEAILSGIGHADRGLIATYLALLAAGDGLAVMKGAVKDLGKMLWLADQAKGLAQRVGAPTRRRS